MSTPRKENWPELLAKYINSRRAAPFVWGTNDCCQFALAWVRLAWRKRMQVEKTLKSLRFGTYKDALGAARKLKRFGGCEGIAAAFAKKLGWQETSPLLAQRGDIVSASTADGPALGVCCGYHSAFPGKAGIVFLLTGDCLKAWRVE